MTVPSPLAPITAAGGRFEVRGNWLRLTARAALSADVVESAFAEARDWHRRRHEALGHWRPLHPEAEATPLAWGESQNRWHRLHGARVPEWQCAGCGEPIGGFNALPLGDGNRVHLAAAHGLDCLIAYGKRWRGTATRALAAMGLQPPADE